MRYIGLSVPISRGNSCAATKISGTITNRLSVDSRPVRKRTSTPRQKLPGTGGYFVAPAPEYPASTAKVLWRAEHVPTAVLLANVPNGFTDAEPLNPALLSTVVVKHQGGDGLHLLLPGDHHLWLLEQRPDKPIAVVIPLDDDFLLRVAGALRFRRILQNKEAGPPPRALRLTPRHRRRLIQMLRALDAHLDEATYREIAAVIFGAKSVSDPGWKTLPVRAQTIRLVKDAIAMMN